MTRRPASSGRCRTMPSRPPATGRRLPGRPTCSVARRVRGTRPSDMAPMADCEVWPVPGRAFEDILDGYFPLGESVRQMMARNRFTSIWINLLHAPVMDLPGLPPTAPVPLHLPRAYSGMIDAMTLTAVLYDGGARMAGVGNWFWIDGREETGTFPALTRLGEPAFIRGIGLGGNIEAGAFRPPWRWPAPEPAYRSRPRWSRRRPGSAGGRAGRGVSASRSRVSGMPRCSIFRARCKAGDSTCRIARQADCPRRAAVPGGWRLSAARSQRRPAGCRGSGACVAAVKPEQPPVKAARRSPWRSRAACR